LSIMKQKKGSEAAKEFRKSFWAGIFTFILVFPLAVLEFYRVKQGLDTKITLLAFFLNILYLGTYYLFIRGYAFLGEKTKNKLLTKTSYALLFIEAITILYTIIILFAPQVEKEFLVTTELALVGIGLIVFGFALQRVKTLGILAKIGGVIQILAGISYFLTPAMQIFSFIAVFLFMINSIFEIVILHAASKKIK